MAELITTAAERTGRNVPIQHQPPRPEPHTLVSDSSRIRADLCWTSPHSTIAQIIDDAWAALGS